MKLIPAQRVMPNQKKNQTFDLDLPDAKWKQTFRRQLKRWYKNHARDLPWRRTREPYHVWISEIMLQQTQVATVIPYFERFLKAFPTIKKLAAADEEKVLRLWEGLGYYRRARQLHKAAKQIVEKHAGKFPSRLEDVDALPGIGRYTRGAILSIAFEQREPILEANTIRLNARLLALEEDTSSKASQNALWDFAEDILPTKDIGLFNQALMELGGAICTPKSPRCLLCPVASICPTRAAGLQAEIPRPKKKMQYEELAETAVVVFKNRDVLLRRCKENERWAGLWDFPRFTSAPSRDANHDASEVKRLSGIDCEMDKEFASIKHGVTKYRITLSCRRAKFISGRLQRKEEVAWVHPKKLADYPLSVTGRKIAKLLVSRAIDPDS